MNEDMLNCWCCNIQWTARGCLKAWLYQELCLKCVCGMACVLVTMHSHGVVFLVSKHAGRKC